MKEAVFMVLKEHVIKSNAVVYCCVFKGFCIKLQEAFNGINPLMILVFDSGEKITISHFPKDGKWSVLVVGLKM